MFAKKTKKVDDGELKVLTADDLGRENIEEKKVEERGGQSEQRLSGSVRTVGMVRRLPLRSASGALINPGRYQTLRSAPPLRPIQPGLRPGIDMQGQTEKIQGVLDVGADGNAFLRPNFVPGVGDVYVSSSQIQRFRLREGDWIVGLARKPRETERFHSFLKADTVNGVEVEKMGQRPDFANLVPIYPQPQIKTETEQGILATRLIDLLCPIGFGQRGLVVSPPKAGKTWLLKQIAQGVAINYPKMKIMAVLVGERPEEVTDIRRSVKGEVVASNFDEKPEQQTRAAETAIARARRLVEMGEDVFIIFDSITRLARAYNLAVPSSGRILSGGFDPAALYPSKRFFGSARNIENGGSLTIIGTALIDTGSKMDDLIYEEFKGTGNMELHLDRKLAEQRVYPAFDLQRSSTRKDDLLLSSDDWKKVTTLRRMLNLLETGEKTSTLVEKLAKSKTNAQFLKDLKNGG